jgi:hypothetical protein
VLNSSDRASAATVTAAFAERWAFERLLLDWFMIPKRF